MKSSAKRVRWFMITLFIVLMALCLGLSMFFIACKSDKDDGDDEGEKENPSGEIVATVTSVTITGPEVNEVEVGSTLTLTATVSMDDGSSYTGSVTWASSNEAIATVSGGTVTGVSEGEANITATAGGVTSNPYSVNVVPATPVYDYNAEESFIVPKTTGGVADSTKYSDGDVITDNTLFTVTATADLEYSKGSDSTKMTSASFKDMHGDTVNPDQGIKLSSYLGQIKEGNPTAKSGSILTISAKEDITLYFYVNYTADGYSGNRAGRITYTIDEGDPVTAVEGTNDSKIDGSKIAEVSVVLEKGQVVTVEAENLDTSYSGNFWFFGAEAKAKEGGNTGSTGSESGESGGTPGGAEFEEDPNYEWIDTYADLETALALAGGSGSNYKTKEDLEVGKFTFGTGVYFENSNNNFTNYGVYDVNNQQKNIYFTVGGTYNNISFRAVESSGSQGTITLYTESGTALHTWTVATSSTVEIDYAKDAGSYLAKGTYYIGSVNSFRIGQLCVSEYLEKSAVTGITVKATTTDFLKGRSITGVDLGISATLDYENGRQDTINLSDLVIVVPTTLTVGANDVTVTYNYTDESNTSTPYTKTVTIYVYYVTSITLSTMSMELTGGTYYTNNLQQVFLVGDAFDSDYLVVTATCSCDVTGMDEVEFILTESEYTITAPDLTTKGEKTVTVSCDLGATEGDPKTDSYTIHVVELTSSTDRAKVQVYNESDTSNTATYETDTATGIISVATINDAIQLIKLMGATDAERKYIYVGAGQYWEKIYIDIPNLSLIGSNSSDTDYLATRQDSITGGTEIVYDAMNGVLDPSGTTTFSTVGSATVTVAEQATGFYAANITFRNYWNTNALYNDALKITSSTQADAAYINADKVHFYNVTFTGYHDTLEAENGRQYYDHCYIEGRTDYIFGNTATCYFYQCNIHTIGAGSSTNGGYVTAVKGGSMTYGYVFDGCNFTSDLESYYGEGEGQTAVPYEGFEYTVEGTVSLGRTWSSADMHVAVLNSTFDAGYSTKAYGDSTDKLNARYESMSGYAPTPAYLVEYNNSGAGAIEENLANTCSMLTEDDAKEYTIENIFAKENGGMSYGSDWDPSKETTITVTVTDAEGSAVAKIYATDSITISNLINAVNARLTDAEVGALYDANGNEMTEAINETTTVYITTKEPDAAIKENLYYEYSDFAALTAEEDGTYSLGGITIDLGTSGTFASNNDNKWYVLTSTTTFTLQVKAGTFIDWWAYQNETLTLKVNGTETEFTATDTTSECLYTYRATEDAIIEIGVVESKTAYIKYIAVNMMFGEGTTDLVSGWPSADYTIQTLAYYKGIRVDASASGAKLALNGNGDWLQINANTVITFSIPEGATASVTFYGSPVEGTDYTMTTGNGFCTVTMITEGNYISGIAVTIAA